MLELIVMHLDSPSHLINDDLATSIAVGQPLVELRCSFEMPGDEDPLLNEHELDAPRRSYSARAASGEPSVDFGSPTSALRKSSRSCRLTPLT